MFLVFLAAAVAATPAPALSDAERQKALANDAQTVCVARLEEEIRISGAKLFGHESVVIDLYSTMTKLKPSEKTLLTSYCNMFDLGASYMVVKLNQQSDEESHQGLRKPFDDVASFTR